MSRGRERTEMTRGRNGGRTEENKEGKKQLKYQERRRKCEREV